MAEEPLICGNCGRIIPVPMAHYLGMGDYACSQYAGAAVESEE